MKRSLVALSVLAILAGCSSTPKPPEPVVKVQNKLEQTPDIKKAEAEFLEANGSLQIQYGDDGQWIMIKTVGTAPVNFNHSQGKEDAFMLASMRAKRNLIEFLNNDVRSNKVTENVSRATLKDLVSSKNKEDRQSGGGLSDEEIEAKLNNASAEDRYRANKIAQSVTESIRDSSQFILKGAFISKREIDRESNLAAVTVQVSRKSINAASQVRNMMNGI